MNMSQRVRISKTFQFEMAHALSGHDGLCRFVHGHSYRLKVTLSGMPSTDVGNPGLGMVMDFAKLKQVVNERIINRFDHAIAVREDAPEASVMASHTSFTKPVLLPFQPSSENLSIYFSELLRESLPPHVRLEELELSETASSSACWRWEDNR